jgi:hypothetical protein
MDYLGFSVQNALSTCRLHHHQYQRGPWMHRLVKALHTTMFDCHCLLLACARFAAFDFVEDA